MRVLDIASATCFKPVHERAIDEKDRFIVCVRVVKGEIDPNRTANGSECDASAPRAAQEPG